MFQRWMAGGLLVCLCFRTYTADQPAATIDFNRDVRPILRDRCIGCHGTTQQNGNYRVDRKGSAFGGGFNGVSIIPGNSEYSRLFWRVTGRHGLRQMPPTGPLSAEEVATLKAWIDQGAPWPDEPPADPSLTRVDPAVVRLADAFRNGDTRAAQRLLKRGSVANLRGADGNTPLMYAVLYADARFVETLLDRGADPNAKNLSGATALMWAVTDPAKVRLLLARGADSTARSEDGRTPLIIAAGLAGSAEVVRMLIEHGADPNERGPGGPLVQAGLTDDESVLKALVDAGATVNGPAGTGAIVNSARRGCLGCLSLLISQNHDPNALGAALVQAARMSDAAVLKLLLEAGAPLDTRDDDGSTPLMLAAYSDRDSMEKVELLLERGANVTLRNKNEQTVMYFAAAKADQPLIAMLRKAGAK